MLQRADLNGTSLALRLDSVLVPGAHGWVAMLPLHDVSDARALAKTVAGLHDQQLVFLDLKAESDQLLGTYLHEALTLSIAGSLAIAILLCCMLRSIRRAGVVLLPLAGAVICTAPVCCASDTAKAVDLQPVRAAPGRRGRVQLLPVLRAQRVR